MMLSSLLLMCLVPLMFIIFISSIIALIFRLTRKKHRKIICNECKKEINVSYKVCPHCGKKLTHISFKIANIFLLLISLISLFIMIRLVFCFLK